MCVCRHTRTHVHTHYTTQNWVYDTYAAAFMQHYGVNNTVSSNVFARVFGACLPGAGGAGGAKGKGPLHCTGFLWHPAYRHQSCGFTFKSNILYASDDSVTGLSQGGRAWHQVLSPLVHTHSSSRD